MDASAKSVTKRIKTLYEDFVKEFPKRKPEHLKAVKVKEEWIPILKSVNMDIIGDRLIFPAYKHTIKIRETKHGLFIDQIAPTGPTGAKPVTSTIILSKDKNKRGEYNHVAYGIKLGHDAQRKISKALDEGDESARYFSHGTLKSSDFRLGDGRMKRGFMRDMVEMRLDPTEAALDGRYLPEGAKDIREDGDDYGFNPAVMAIIRVR